MKESPSSDRRERRIDRRRRRFVLCLELSNLDPFSEMKESPSSDRRIDRSGNQSKSMKGRLAIRRCRQLELKRKNECGLWSLPEHLVVDCLLPQLSRLDLVALSMASKRYRRAAVSRDLRIVRSRNGCLHPYVYVYMHMHPDPSPRWFVIHPVERRLKRLNMDPVPPAPVAGSCFVKDDWRVFVIGGLVNGKPTSDVTVFDYSNHTVFRIAPMKMPRSGASASLIDQKKIYVFGGCSDWDVAADSSNWAEVYDLETGTWEFLSLVFTRGMPRNIQQSVVMAKDGETLVYAVDETGLIFIFFTSDCTFEAAVRESNPENRHDWVFTQSNALFCRGIGGRILWRLPLHSDWKELKGLEELHQQHIIKLCLYDPERIAIFWEARPQGGPDDHILELWYAEISIASHLQGEVLELSGNIEWSGPVLSSHSSSPSTAPLNLFYAASLFL